MAKKKSPASTPPESGAPTPESAKAPRARDLLPPDGPAPVDPARRMAADASFEPEVETRKIGIRRVSGLDFGNRMYDRANRRPAGNSRAFWSKIEADDPFKKAPARPTDAPLEVYAAQRIERVDGSMPKPQPDVARAAPPPARDPNAPQKPTAPRLERDERAAAERAARQGRPPPLDEPAPRAKPEAPAVRKPVQEAKRPARPAPPEPTHTPEPRPAPRPPPRAAPEPDEPEDDAPPPRPQADQVVPAPPHRLPPKPGANPKAGTGRLAQPTRQRMPSKAAPDAPGPVPPVVAAGTGKSAAEIRAEKLKAREAGTSDPPPAKKHDLDAYRAFVQMMEIQQAAYERGEEIPVAFADKADEPPRPKPKAIVSKRGEEPIAEPPAPAPRPAAPRPAAPAPQAAPAAPPVDRTPPKPKPKEAAPAPKPAAPGKPADLDDLFGGAQEGRVRIGKRALPKEPGPEGT